MRKESSPWSFLVMFLNCLYRKFKQTANISFMHFKMFKCFKFHKMREGSRDLCGAVTELRGFRGM